MNLSFLCNLTAVCVFVHYLSTWYRRRPEKSTRSTEPGFKGTLCTHYVAVVDFEASVGITGLHYCSCLMQCSGLNWGPCVCVSQARDSVPIQGCY